MFPTPERDTATFSSNLPSGLERIDTREGHAFRFTDRRCPLAILSSIAAEVHELGGSAPLSSFGGFLRQRGQWPPAGNDARLKLSEIIERYGDLGRLVVREGVTRRGAPELVVEIEDPDA